VKLIIEQDQRAMVKRLRAVTAQARFGELVRIDESELRQLLAFSEQLLYTEPKEPSAREERR